MDQPDHLNGFEVIYSYTREQAIEDGVLVDVSCVARQVGVRLPTAVTAAVWTDYVEVPDEVAGQDETGRLWDILWMFRVEAGRVRNAEKDQVYFRVLVRNHVERVAEVDLKAVCGPGDRGEPVITIMLPGED